MMVEKPELTEKEKALKSLRLLFNAIYAPADYYTPPNDIYEARRTIEKFIESAGVLESIPDDIHRVTSNGVDEMIYKGATFRVGEQALVKTPAMGFQWMNIVKFYPENFGVSLEGHGYKGSASYDEVAELNPEGSRK